jgi:ABC-type glutathione transport system ATPase component
MNQDDSQNSPENPAEFSARPRVVDGGRGLVVTRIGKSFKQRPVVRSVSLSVKRGEVVGLLGPNGAGKTTCFYMISGLIPADTGSIEVDGHDVTSLPMYRRARLGIGYLPQEASIFRGLTAEQNIRATAELIEPDPMRLEAAVEALLAEFGITHIRNTPPSPCRAASAAGWKSRAHSPPIPLTSCSTSPWRASTPSRWAKSATWFGISKTAASAC